MLGIVLALTVSWSTHAALLVGVTKPGDMSSSNDCAVVREGLIRRGWKTDEIEVLTGSPFANEFASAIQRLKRRSAAVSVVFISAQGEVDRIRMEASPAANWPSWQSILSDLGEGSSQSFLVWADTGYTNLVPDQLPANVSFLGLQGTWHDLGKVRTVSPLVHRGVEAEYGVMSYVLARELPYATTQADLAYRITNYKNSGSMGAIWFDAPLCEITGPGDWTIPGLTLKI